MNGLLRVIDGLVSSSEWDRLLDVADLCEEAAERGKQLWPIAAHIDYRIALEAPGDYAAGVIPSDLERFMLGPLTEVTASTHRWAELSAHLDEPTTAAYVAQERVLRGEVLEDDPRAFPDILGLPLRLQPWEPTYSLATYRSDVVEVAEPWEPRAPMEEFVPTSYELLDEPDLAAALVELAHQWTTESNGAATARVVEGGAVAAVSAITPDAFQMGPLSVDEAVLRMAWAAASGGAFGRRRGAAFGRSLAWHVGSQLADLGPGTAPDDLGRALSELEWYRWEEGAEEEGWVLRLAVEDRSHGWAAAVAATDLVGEDDGE
ncbi:MAG: hypothetical protein QOH90_217 [Actinomycetota bacterium]|nr:hypothetical protein [Actinomycetota bacterium]